MLITSPGEAAINALLRATADFEILAVTRNAYSPSAQNLLKKSAQINLITRNLDNANENFQKAKEASTIPMWGVYSEQVSNTILSIYLKAHPSRRLYEAQQTPRRKKDRGRLLLMFRFEMG
jgi:hypothetical protein